MKKILPIIICFFSIFGLAQAPNGFNYQASVRDANGDLYTGQSVSFMFHIIQGTQTDAPIYSETHGTNTDDLGQVSLIIGKGNAVSGTFSTIDWSLGSYFLKIEVELSSGSGYIDLGTTQFMSVPYAMYAQSSGSNLPQGTSSGDTLKWDASTNSWVISSGDISANNEFEIRTSKIEFYSNNSATSGGEIVADGGSSVTARGVVWGLNENPTIDNSKTVDGTGSGAYSSELTNLTESTSYYYRAYATNSNSTIYGTTYSFETMSGSDDNDGDGFTVQDGDCNDLDFTINPAAFEIQGDGIDQNCDGVDEESPVYISANGLTVKARSWAKIGDVGQIDGRTYTIVSKEQLENMINQGLDYSLACTSLITDMSNLFNNKTKNFSISSWDTGNVINMERMFFNANNINNDLEFWDTSKVTNMSYMFSQSAFNNHLYRWDVGLVENMSFMFFYNQHFNKPLQKWNTSSVTNMSNMFGQPNSNADSRFNQNLSDWDTSNVVDMSNMFSYADSFNGELNGWSFGANANLYRMFANATSFNQDLSSWDTSNVSDMAQMFRGARAFNSNLSGWNTSKVTDMQYMFQDAQVFNQDLSSWDVSNVNTMQSMFYNARSFNQNLSSWVTSSVIDMYRMFREAESFNQDISGWDTSNVVNMTDMFYIASSFNQDLSSWNVANVTSATNFCYSTPSWTLPKPNFTNIANTGCN